MDFQNSPRFLEWVLVSTFKIQKYFFCHFGWSALWLLQTVLVFKLAHNVLRVYEVGDFGAQNIKVTTNDDVRQNIQLITEHPIS